jgi:hypothetical protein
MSTLHGLLPLAGQQLIRLQKLYFLCKKGRGAVTI